jgi:drebrin-like protein
MASLNLSTNGPSITKSYQSVVNAPPPSGLAAGSPTYGQWAVFTVSAPLVNAFQQDSGNKESVLKVQSTGGRYLATSCL